MTGLPIPLIMSANFGAAVCGGGRGDPCVVVGDSSCSPAMRKEGVGVNLCNRN